jgi:glycerophosphoryl diester phosphodiesterase
MKRMMAALAVLAVVTMSGTVAASSTSAAVPTHPAVRAHRGGLHFDLVENTALNFRAAATEGRLAWEMDVRFTSTDVPVVLHDPTLGLFGCPTKSIASITTTAMRACVASNDQSASTLYEALAELPPTGTVWAELKTDPTEAQWTVLDARFAGVKSRLVLESFATGPLAEAVSRGYKTAYLSTTTTSPGSLPPGTDWFSVTWTAISAAQVDAMHTAGVKVSVWTVGTLDRDSVPAGVDEVISNDVLYGM